ERVRLHGQVGFAVATPVGRRVCHLAATGHHDLPAGELAAIDVAGKVRVDVGQPVRVEPDPFRYDGALNRHAAASLRTRSSARPYRPGRPAHRTIASTVDDI